ncbi:MAG TPA: hypothetical protein VJ824_06755 [Bacillota bacterium]|nr:hypothetical protein [Bacillota bacterium]
MKRTKWIILFFLLFTSLGCTAQPQQQQHTSNVDQGTQIEASRRGSYSGGQGSIGGATRQPISSGVRRPSPNVTNPTGSYGTPGVGTGTPARSGGFWSNVGAFGAGAFAGSMLGSIFHPFGGGYYGYGGYGGGFSFFGILFWIVVIGLVFSWFRRKGRNRY